MQEGAHNHIPGRLGRPGGSCATVGVSGPRPATKEGLAYTRTAWQVLPLSYLLLRLYAQQSLVSSELGHCQANPVFGAALLSLPVAKRSGMGYNRGHRWSTAPAGAPDACGPGPS